MMTANEEFLAVQRTVVDLERPLQNVEDHLVALGLALHRQDADGVEGGSMRSGLEGKGAGALACNPA